jgi:hypothetical protein
MAGSCEYGNEPSGYIKGSSWLTERLLASQEGICTIKLIKLQGDSYMEFNIKNVSHHSCCLLQSLIINNVHKLALSNSKRLTHVCVTVQIGGSNRCISSDFL